MNMDNFAIYTPEKIKDLRKRLNLSQEEFAQKLGVSFTSVNRWENGQAKPSKLAKKQIEAFIRQSLREVYTE